MSIRDIDTQSIIAYLEAAARRGAFEGDVLDFGAGKQPYRRIVENAGGKYTPYDRMDFPASVATTDVGPDDPLDPLVRKWDAVLCTQMLQYVNAYAVCRGIFGALHPGGRFVLTCPTNWPIVETEDLHRFTVEGVVRMLGASGFVVVDAHYRATVKFEGETWPLGLGAIATKGE